MCAGVKPMNFNHTGSVPVGAGVNWDLLVAEKIPLHRPAHPGFETGSAHTGGATVACSE